jgi:hypothetical protein
MGIFIFTTASRPILEPTQRPIQWVPAAVSVGVNWPGRETDHSPPSSAEVNNVWSYTPPPNTPPCGGDRLRENTGTVLPYFTLLYLTKWNTSFLLCHCMLLCVILNFISYTKITFSIESLFLV